MLMKWHLAAHDLAKLDFWYAAGVRRVKSPADMAISDNDDDNDQNGDGGHADDQDDDNGDEVSLKDGQQSRLIRISSALARDQPEVFVERQWGLPVVVMDRITVMIMVMEVEAEVFIERQWGHDADNSDDDQKMIIWFVSHLVSTETCPIIALVCSSLACGVNVVNLPFVVGWVVNVSFVLVVNISFVLVVNISCGGVNLFNIPHIIVTNITSKEIPKTNTYINLSSIQICILYHLEAKTAQKFLSFPKIQNPVLVVVEQLIEKSLIRTVLIWMDIVSDILDSWTYF